MLRDLATSSCLLSDLGSAQALRGCARVRCHTPHLRLSCVQLSSNVLQLSHMQVVNTVSCKYHIYLYQMVRKLEGVCDQVMNSLLFASHSLFSKVCKSLVHLVLDHIICNTRCHVLVFFLSLLLRGTIWCMTVSQGLG